MSIICQCIHPPNIQYVCATVNMPLQHLPLPFMVIVVVPEVVLPFSAQIYAAILLISHPIKLHNNRDRMYSFKIPSIISSLDVNFLICVLLPTWIFHGIHNLQCMRTKLRWSFWLVCTLDLKYQNMFFPASTSCMLGFHVCVTKFSLYGTEDQSRGHVHLNQAL